ncbi:MAG: hypothetical protein ABL897_04345 [Hyphomicrobium sp.]
MLKPFDIVVINSGYEDAEVRGARGHIIGEVCSDQIGVFVYGIERVWCLHPREVTATGDVDVAARDEPRGPSIRVNSKGEVIG